MSCLSAASSANISLEWILRSTNATRIGQTTRNCLPNSSKGRKTPAEEACVHIKNTQGLLGENAAMQKTPCFLVAFLSEGERSTSAARNMRFGTPLLQGRIASDSPPLAKSCMRTSKASANAFRSICCLPVQIMPLSSPRGPLRECIRSRLSTKPPSSSHRATEKRYEKKAGPTEHETGERWVYTKCDVFMENRTKRECHWFCAVIQCRR